MPKVKIGSEWRSFPFNEDVVSRLLYHGHDVQPDDGIDPEQMQGESLLVTDRLSKLWGDQNMRTMEDRWRLSAPPALREDDRFGFRMQAPGTRNEGGVRLVQPNPTIKYHMPAATLIKPMSWDL